jgi:VWFA-related protein
VRGIALLFQLVWILAAASLVTSAAQVSGQTGPPIIKETVRQVLVPVVVTDKAGHHIAGLKPTDFQVLEDGTPQDLVGFNIETETLESAALPHVSGSVSGQTLADTQKSNAVDSLPKRTYLICLDTLHSAFGNFTRVRTALRKFFQEEHGRDSQYALMALDRSVHVLQDSTRDPATILATLQDKKFLATIENSETASVARDIQQFTYMMRDYCNKCACEVFGTNADLPGCSGPKSRVQLFLTSFGERTSVLDRNFLQALRAVVTATATMPATRTIVFISDGFNRFPGQELYSVMDGFGPKDRSFVFNRRDANDGLQSILKLAVRYNVKFYTLDSRGVYTMASLGRGAFDASTGNGAYIPNRVDTNMMTIAHENTDALAELARETGGLFFENNNDLLKGIRRAFADGREHYVLAYVSKNKIEDGSFRRIAVKVKNGKLHVNAKAGYWASKD